MRITRESNVGARYGEYHCRIPRLLPWKTTWHTAEHEASRVRRTVDKVNLEDRLVNHLGPATHASPAIHPHPSPFAPLPKMLEAFGSAETPGHFGFVLTC